MIEEIASKAVSQGQANPRILVVDDDERNLLALSQVLMDTAEVVTAASGKDALRLLLAHDFAVVLLDVYMPGMDGYEVAGLIRERQQTAHTPIIFLSAVNKEMEHLLRGYALGAVDYVFKPVDPLILKSKVSVFVELYRMRQQIEANSREERELREANFRAQLEKLAMQRALDESRARQEAIISSLPIVLYLEPEHAEQRMPHFVGGNFEAVTGYSFEAVKAEPGIWLDRLHVDDRERVLAALEERKRSGALAIEYRWLCAQGHYKYFMDQAVLLPAGDGQPAQFAGTLIDVSERKQLEAQLLQAGKLDAMGQLTGGVAHDFNNLLAAILGGINLLQRRAELAPREQTVLDHMRHAAENGAALVQRMMAFARKQDLRPTTVMPERITQSVLGLVQHVLGGTVDLQWHHAAATRNLFVDQGQLELALVNLIINARDAMPEGGRIVVTFEDAGADEARRHQLSDLPYVRISVSDEGGGIPEELIERIVEPFFTTKEAGKGTGLGLSMVVGFAQQSGGKLSIRSALGTGTTMDLFLPASPGGDVAQPRLADRSAVGELSRKSILLVDDDDTIRAILSEQLLDLNLNVISVPSGARALEVLAEADGDIDILLTDFAMPGINGLETIRRARELGPDLRAILMTGYADDTLLCQDVPLLRKPIDLHSLKQALQ